VTEALESISSPLPGQVDDIIPRKLLRKRAGIGRLLQSQLSNPCLVDCLDQLCDLSRIDLRIGHLLRKDEANHTTPVPIQSLYILPTVSESPILVMVSLVMSERVATGAAGEISPGWAPSLLPEYSMEVVS